jgi:hypothetical protein
MVKQGLLPQRTGTRLFRELRAQGGPFGQNRNRAIYWRSGQKGWRLSQVVGNGRPSLALLRAGATPVQAVEAELGPVRWVKVDGKTHTGSLGGVKAVPASIEAPSQAGVSSPGARSKAQICAPSRPRSKNRPSADLQPTATPAPKYTETWFFSVAGPPPPRDRANKRAPGAESEPPDAP